MLHGARIGSLIGAIFGLVFFLANAEYLGSPTGNFVEIIGIILFLVTIYFGIFNGRDEVAASPPSRAAMRVYGIAVGIEVVALIGGLALISQVFKAEYLSPMWIGLVVGVHFLPFAKAFGAQVFRLLGVAMIAVALVGALVGTVIDHRLSYWAAIVEGLLLFASVIFGPAYNARHDPEKDAGNNSAAAAG